MNDQSKVPLDKKPGFKRSPWRAMLLIVIAIVGAFFVQQLLQPEFAADAAHCVAKQGAALVNNCEEPVNVTVCPPSDAAADDCRLYQLAPGQTTDAATGLPGRQIASSVHACKPPFIPERRRNINNASLWENGCVAD